MLVCDIAAWKCAMEGMARGLVGPYEQRNRLEGDDPIREYLDGRNVVMRMCVIGGEVKPSQDCERVFEIDEAIIKATAHIYVPTQADWDEWDALPEGTDERKWLRDRGIIE